MIGKITSWNGVAGIVLDIEEDRPLNFVAADVVGSIEQGNLCTYSVAWAEMIPRAIMVTKKE